MERGPASRAVYLRAGQAYYDRVTGPNVGQGCVADVFPAVASNGQFDLAWRMIETLYIEKGYVGTTETCSRPVYPEREANTGSLFSLFQDTQAAIGRNPRIWRTFDAVGLTRYWRETNRWPDFCTDRSLPYDCRSMAAARR